MGIICICQYFPDQNYSELLPPNAEGSKQGTKRAHPKSEEPPPPQPKRSKHNESPKGKKGLHDKISKYVTKSRIERHG